MFYPHISGFDRNWLILEDKRSLESGIYGFFEVKKVEPRLNFLLPLSKFLENRLNFMPLKCNILMNRLNFMSHKFLSSY